MVVVFPLIVLGAIEVLLRLVGYGPDTRFVVTRLVRDDGTRIMGINPHAWMRYHFRLTGRQRYRTRWAEWQEFTEPKPANTFRVFFIGGSTVQGYPHSRRDCAAPFLEVLLQQAWPDRRVEVINCGVTAINSFSLREWAPQVLKHEPDLLAVYAGHNEFYGAYGGGSLNSIGANRNVALFHLALRRLKLVEALNDALNRLRGIFRPLRGTLMELLVKDRTIPLDSALYNACRDSFRANLTDIVRAARRRDIPVLLCSLVCNERDLVPFRSLRAADLVDKDRGRFDEAFAAGMAALENDDWHIALPFFQTAVALDPGHAGAAYRSAQCFDRRADFGRACTRYRRARDLDGLRFRATEEFTDIIRDVARSHDALYADVAGVFSAESADGLIGWNLMTDHLHPDKKGQYLIARTIAEALCAHDGRSGAGGAAQFLSYEEVRDRLDIDSLDDVMSKITVLILARRFPFEGTPNESLSKRLSREVATWQRENADPAVREGFRDWARGDTWDIVHYNVAKAYEARKRWDEAATLYRRAFLRSTPHSVESARARAGMARCAASRAQEGSRGDALIDDAQEALDYLDDCAAMNPDRRDDLLLIRAEVGDLAARSQ